MPDSEIVATVITQATIRNVFILVSFNSSQIGRWMPETAVLCAHGTGDRVGSRLRRIIHDPKNSSKKERAGVDRTVGGDGGDRPSSRRAQVASRWGQGEQCECRTGQFGAGSGQLAILDAKTDMNADEPRVKQHEAALTVVSRERLLFEIS